MDNNIIYYTILSSSLLFVSEILPYIPKIKGNGIIQVFINYVFKYNVHDDHEELRNLMKRIERMENFIKQSTLQ